MSKIIGISLGTGDPDLLTLKAYKALQSVDVIAYISSNGSSFARTIADCHIKPSTIEVDINMPMETSTNTATIVYDTASQKIIEHINSGKSVGILCEGDALFYGSFMYLYDRLKNICPVEIIPGVTSLSAGASVAQLPLTSRNDVLTIIPAPNSEDIIRHHVQNSDSVAFMKIGRHFDKIKSILKQENLLENAVCVTKATCHDQEIHSMSDIDTAPYFSIIIVRKNTIRIMYIHYYHLNIR